jgi:pimeloyl-ACP methyl ester carboxylesterase
MAKPAHASAPIESDIQVEHWPADRLIPRATNPRTHSREQVANIAASIREWGWTNPILVGADRPGGMRAGFEYFRAFEQDAQDFARFAQTPLLMPMLVLAGEKASGDFLIQQGRLVAKNVEGVVVRGSGHWLMEEAPRQVIPKLVHFLDR